MPAYTTKAVLEGLLPSNLPAEITDAVFAEWIADASAEVDAEVGPDFPVQDSGQKFTDAPGAPSEIERCARWLAGHYGYMRLKELNRSRDVPTNAERYRGWAEAKLRKIRNGEIDLRDSAGEELDTDAPAGMTVEARDQIFTSDVLDLY